MQQLREELPYTEFLGWQEYLERRPPGWREDQRTAMLLQSFGAKARPEELFDSLARLKAAEDRRKASQPNKFALQFLRMFGHKISNFDEVITLEE